MVSIEDSSQKDLLKICNEHLEVTLDMLQCKVFPTSGQHLWWNVSHCVIIGWFPWWACQLSSELHDGQNMMLFISDSTIPGIVLTQNIYNIVFNVEWVMAFLIGVTCVHSLWIHPPSKLYGFSQASLLFIYVFAKWGYCTNHFLTGVISTNVSQTGPSSKHELWLDSIDWLVDNKLTCQ